MNPLPANSSENRPPSTMIIPAPETNKSVVAGTNSKSLAGTRHEPVMVKPLNGSTSSGSAVSANSSLNYSSNSSGNNTGNTGSTRQGYTRKTRFGSLCQSLLSNDTSQGILSPNAVRGIMNPIRSRLGLPPLEQVTLDESELEKSSSSESNLETETLSPPSNLTPSISAEVTEYLVVETELYPTPPGSFEDVDKRSPDLMPAVHEEETSRLSVSPGTNQIPAADPPRSTTTDLKGGADSVAQSSSQAEHKRDAPASISALEGRNPPRGQLPPVAKHVGNPNPNPSLVFTPGVEPERKRSPLQPIASSGDIQEKPAYTPTLVPPGSISVVEPTPKPQPHSGDSVERKAYVPSSLYPLPEDQNLPPNPVPMPGVAVIVRPNPLTLHRTPVSSKSFCPPPAPIGPPTRGLGTLNSQNRSGKKPLVGWRFTTDSIGDKEYLLLKVLGKGGCGEVTLAMEKKTRDLFAIKQINLAGLDQLGVEECINEIKLLVELKDTNLVIHIEAWEMNQSERTIKIVMEYGQCDLTKTISDKTISLTKVKGIWERMLQIVQTIHDRGIVHADLKPANFVWVGGNLKIIDFGIANKLQPEFTSIATLNPKGTLNFISPETVGTDAYGRSKISPKSDIWSLGCILHYMIFGHTPFQHIHFQPSKITAIIQGVKSYPPLPPRFEGTPVLSVLQQCFQLDPKVRPSAAELLVHPFLE